MKVNRKFNAFTDLKSLELEVPKICLVTGCVSARRDRRYGRLLEREQKVASRKIGSPPFRLTSLRLFSPTVVSIENRLLSRRRCYRPGFLRCLLRRDSRPQVSIHAARIANGIPGQSAKISPGSEQDGETALTWGRP